MSSDEFSDLQNFGKTIDQKPKDDAKKEVKKKKDISEKIRSIPKFSARKIIDFTKQLLKCIITIVKCSSKKVKNRFRNSHQHKIQKIAVFSKKRPNKIKNSTCYKIVETKKQRWNKTIITRRRVPVGYKTGNMQVKRNNLGALFYLTFKFDETGNQEIKPEEYCTIKKSVWDFPIEKNEKWRYFFNFKRR